MKVRHLFFCMLALVASGAAMAGYNATVTGTVTLVQQMGPSMGYTAETFQFQLDTQPTDACGSGMQRFLISPNSVPDAQMRKNYVAMVLTAKSTGNLVTIGYDNLATSCDQGFPSVFWLALL